MEWIDSNHVKGEMSDEDFLAKIQEEAKTRDVKLYGRDGSFVVYEERFVKHGIPYFIKINRYYQIDVPLNKIQGMNKLGRWAVLEYTDETKPIHDLVSSLPYPLGDSEWMWRDTLHYGQGDWTLKEMVAKMHEEAEGCINEIGKLKPTLRKYKSDTTKQVNEVLKLFESFEAVKND